MPKQIDSFERQVMRSVAANIRQLREKNGASVKDLADYLSCSTRAVESYESGARRVSLADAVRLATFFRVPIDTLVLGERPPAKVIPLTSLDQLRGNPTRFRG
jgi:transcriptional regulator with XRE-family HTH domain